MMTTASLDGLLEKLASGDAGAAEAVFRTYEPYLRKVVRRQLNSRLRSKFDSIDVVQSVMADVMQGFRANGWRFPDPQHLRAFLVKATRNRFIDRCRRHQSAIECERPIEAAEPNGRPRSPDPRPSQIAQAGDLWRRMLDLCPPRYHDLLEFKRQGLTLAEVAARTGLHEDSIRRVLRTLARRLACHSPAGVFASAGARV